MSWGERSCCQFGECTRPIRTINSCNVDCPAYRWDGTTEPDSEPASIHQMPLHKLRELKPLKQSVPLTRNQRKRKRRR